MSTRSTAASTRGWTSFWTRLMIRRHWMTMTDVDRLLREYIERFESGGSSDPGDLLEQVEGREREKLTVLIQGYLEHSAPAQDWDAEALRRLGRRAGGGPGGRDLDGGGRRAAAGARPAAQPAGDHPRGAGHEARRAPRRRRRPRAGRLLLPPARARAAAGARESPRGSGTRSPSCSKRARMRCERPGPRCDRLPPGGSAAAYARTAPPPPEEYAGEQRADEGMASPPEPESREAAEVDRLFTGG